jgi:RNA polymerase sigma-70 factor (ECF subfamily)
MDQSETQLVRRAKNGDPAAFAQLVEKYSGRIYNLALRMMRNREDAEDILQETFLSAYEKLHTFDERSTFYTWIYRIAVNASLMKLRSRHHKQTFFSLDEPEHEEITRGSLVDWSQYPVHRLLDDEAKAKMEEAIEQLPDIYRSVFVLRDLEQLSIKETAQILNLTEDNVKTRLRRARLFLRDILSDYFQERVRRNQKGA